jgi:hypothetical protein
LPLARLGVPRDHDPVLSKCLTFKEIEMLTPVSILRRSGLILALALGLGGSLGAAVHAAGDTSLILGGKVTGGEVTLTREQMGALPQHELTEQPTNFPAPSKFRGPLLADVLTLAGAKGDATLVALDDYKVTITADEMARYHPILALEVDGQSLATQDFGPYFVMWPFKQTPEIDNETFQAKAIWQVIKIDVR